MAISSNVYALAHGLIGFASDTLRVKVTERRNGYVWVITADLLDAGCPLTLNENQVEFIEAETVQMHKTGLVAFA